MPRYTNPQMGNTYDSKASSVPRAAADTARKHQNTSTSIVQTIHSNRGDARHGDFNGQDVGRHVDFMSHSDARHGDCNRRSDGRHENVNEHGVVRHQEYICHGDARHDDVDARHDDFYRQGDARHGDFDARHADLYRQRDVRHVHFDARHGDFNSLGEGHRKDFGNRKYVRHDDFDARHGDFSGRDDAFQQDFLNRGDLCVRRNDYIQRDDSSQYAGRIGELSLADRQTRTIIKLNDTQQPTRHQQRPHSATSHNEDGIQPTALSNYQRLNTHTSPNEEYQHQDADIHTSGNKGKVMPAATTNSKELMLVNDGTSVSLPANNNDSHRRQIKIGSYDGTSAFETFIAKFNNAASYNKWSDDDSLANMKACLTGNAANVLWDTPTEKQNTLQKLIDILSTRFGNAGMAERYRCELRSRRRLPGETLQSLHQDVQRLTSLAFQGPWNEATDIIARDAFIDALQNKDLALKVREREPLSLDSAVKTALRLESYVQQSTTNEERGKIETTQIRVAVHDEQQTNTLIDQLKRQLENTQARLNKLEQQKRHEPDTGHEENGRLPRKGNRESNSSSKCFNCDEVGHFARNCPKKGGKKYNKHREFIATEYAQHKKVNGSTDGSNSFPVYLNLSIGNNTVSCLIDTGCEKSMLPGNLATHIPLDEHNQQVTAANGTTIHIIGSKLFHIKLNGIPFQAEMLVSNDIEEAMLGIDFLMNHECHWQVHKAMMTIDKNTLHLHSKQHQNFCRRVYCCDTTIIPAQSQQDVLISMPLKNFNDTAEDMLIEAGQLQPGLLMASSVLPGVRTQAMIRVCNTKQCDITLKAGIQLATARNTTVYEATEPPTSTRKDKVDAIISKLYNTLPDSLSDEFKHRVVQLLHSYEQVLSVDDYDLGYTDILQHKIDTGSHRPVREPLRRHPQPYLKFIDEEVDKMLQANIIEPAHSDWASNVCLAKKQDGSLRFAIDFRRVNRLSKPDSYPIPRIDSCLDTLNGSSWFTTIDLKSAFWQVAQDPADADKTTFITRKGSFRFRVLAFGLQGSPSLFQRVMDLVLSGLTWQICLVYIDDIIIFSRTPETHLQRLEQVLQRLAAHNLKIKPSKLHLFQQRLTFLGYQISAEGISTDPEKTRTVLQMRRPQNIKELRSYLGCFGYYRRFISQFSPIAEPLYALLRKGVKFTWTDKQQRAFEILKSKLATAPVLALPCDEAQTILDVDASDSGLGAVLSHVIDGEEKPVAYASRTFSQAESKYCIARRELLGLIYGLKHFRQYCLGRHIIIRTDHAPLLSIQTTPNPSAQICRWMDFLQEYDFTILHRPGIRHGNADGCSRFQSACKQCNMSAESYARLDNAASMSSAPPKSINVCSTRILADSEMDIKWHQQKDPDLQPVRQAIHQSMNMPDWTEFHHCSEETKNLVAQWPLLTLQNDILYRKYIDGHKKTRWLQCIIPYDLREEVMKAVHTGMTGGHYGARKTCSQLQRRAYWKSWRQDCIRYVKRCPQCASYRRGQPPRQGELQDMQVGAPMERAGIDLTGPWPRSDNKIYILTFIDHFTKWADAIPLPNKEAHTVAKALVNRIFTQVGCVSQLLSDQGKEFDNSLMNSLCHLLQTDKIRTTPYKASTNACVERLHRSMNSLIAKCIDENQRNWTEVLPHVMAAYRSSVHESTGYSPNFLFYAREIRAPIDLMLQPPPEQFTTEDFVDLTERNMRYAYNLVRTQLQTQAARRKRYYDMKLHRNVFQKHDWVWYFHPRRRTGKSIKWQRLYTGPYLVIDKVGPVNFIIQRSARADPMVVHIDKLKHYEGETPKSWLLPLELTLTQTSLPDPMIEIYQKDMLASEQLDKIDLETYLFHYPAKKLTLLDRFVRSDNQSG